MYLKQSNLYTTNIDSTSLLGDEAGRLRGLNVEICGVQVQ